MIEPVQHLVAFLVGLLIGQVIICIFITIYKWLVDKNYITDWFPIACENFWIWFGERRRNKWE